MQPTLVRMYLDQIQAVGIHGLFLSEVQRAHFSAEISRQVFPDEPGRSDFHYDVQVPGNSLKFFAPHEPHPSVVSARPHLLASVAYDPYTLLWGFADHFADVRELSPVPRAVLEFGRANNLDGFYYQAFEYAPADYSLDDAALLATELMRYLGGCAVEILGPGYYPMYVTTSATSRQLILATDFQPGIKPLTAELIAHYLKPVVDYAFTAKIEMHTPLQGLARHTGLTFEHATYLNGNEWRLSDSERTIVVRVGYQDMHRTVSVELV